MNFTEWQDKLKARWQTWARNPRATLTTLGANSLYFGLAGTALYPIAAAVAQGDLSAVGLLYTLTSGVGVNLIANTVQQWADEPAAAQGLEAAAAQQPDLVPALDVILAKLNALEAITPGLPEADRAWFQQTLAAALQRAGSTLTITGNTITNTGSGAVAVGPGAAAAGAGGVVVQGSVYGNINPPATPSAPALPAADLRHAYLNWLIEQTRAVPLAGVDRKSISEETRRDLDLAAVYTALITNRQSVTIKAALEFGETEATTERHSALNVLNTEARLALLGDPGSGKSTFVNFVALCMAGELIGHPEANLRRLTTPLPAEDEETPAGQDDQGEAGPPPQPWDHGALLPVRVVLRDFVARTPASAPATGETLWRFIVAELPEHLRDDFSAALRAEWLARGGLLLLDGLDEVPEADHRREQVKGAVEQFAASFPKVRVLATSRTYAYQKQDWKLKHFAEAVLAPFGEAQIRRFVEQWYAFVAQAGRLKPEDAQGRAAALNGAIGRSARLQELAARPLLLTLMASLHAWRGGALPDQREQLYAEAVDLLLDQWESQKLKRKPDGTFELLQPSLAEWLNVDQKAVRQLLNRLAFEAHRDQPDLQGTADIAQERLIAEMLRLNPNPDARPARLEEYLRDRAGLLEPRGVGVYAFPHRTFQEYLAACHLTDHGFPDEVAELLRRAPNRWREVTLLAGAKAAHGTTAAVWTLAEALCYQPPAERLDEAGAWGALLAAQTLIENDSLKTIPDRHQAKVDNIRHWLTQIALRGALPPVDRALAGEALDVFGDPRDFDELVTVPAGKFWMGSHENGRWLDERTIHEVMVGDFRIGKYLVTVGQWRAFVAANPDHGHNPDSCIGRGNHPVHDVSWPDALAYCRWLTNEWLRSGKISPRDEVRLPTEAEWEKAARGADQREWPWGNDFDSARANMSDTNINRSCAVGLFPAGASPYGALDMAGNMWEWCQSKGAGYPYDPHDGREKLDGEEWRVLRGGAFSSHRRGLRCAYRNLFPPVTRRDFIGFRVVVVSPGS